MSNDHDAASIAPGWQEKTLGETLAIKYGKGLPARDRVEGDVPVFSAAGHTGWHNEALTAGASIVIARKGVGIGDTFLAPEPCWVIDTAYYAEVPDRFNPEFLVIQLTALELRQLDQSTAIPSLTRDDLNKVKIRFPDRAAQDQIVERVKAQFAMLDATESTLMKTLRKVEQMRRSIRLHASSGSAIPPERAVIGDDGGERA